ncbi:hypothetical protein C2857_003869 [Epichloe festucae Fl1]|uniref:Mannosyl phosphorylinositol ceramide synthase SUR1 n=1 Tax=Epichloe festucae (strain Fl1) TaxID=877507 RepID=A0A7U3SMG4_EPIFF|nr:hypothetical protein C2857_003869 [Epichloe festucae Fl1]
MLARGPLPHRLKLATFCTVTVCYFLLTTVRNLFTDDALLRSHFHAIGIESPAQDDASLPTLELIPRIIHQTYKSNKIPATWQTPHQSCLTKNPEGNWTHILWTDETARDLIHDWYPWFLPTYEWYPYHVQRVDSFRYFVLHHLGGIYLDLDVGCKKDLSPLLTQHAFFGKTEPFGVSNDVMGAERGHPVFGRLIASLEDNRYRRGTKYPTVMMSTGPMFVTKVVLGFLKAQNHDEEASSRRFSSQESLVTILPPRLYGSSADSYFRHFPGSTWHSWDARILLTINDSPFVFLLGVLIFCFMSVQWMRRARNRFVRKEMLRRGKLMPRACQRLA